MKLIAIGSVFQDDAVSWKVIQNITPALTALCNDISIEYCGDPGTQLVHLLNKGQPTLLVDALLSNDEPGSIIQLDLEDLLNQQQHFSSHQLSVANILQLARNIGNLPEQLYIFGIAIDLEKTLDDQQLITTEQQLLEYIQAVCLELTD